VEVRLRLGSRVVQVALVPEGDGWAATVDGEAHRVRCLGAGPSVAVGVASVEELALEIDGSTRRVVVARTRDRVLVSLAGRAHAFETGEEGPGAHAGAGSGTVTAPMPGKVLSVLVAAGDQVVVGQALVVLEAMKMESTLGAEVAGRVRAVAAVAGALVAAGDLLVEIEPSA
jgi:3-methylcrotonyl-CoA carboxylase alpha subunit